MGLFSRHRAPTERDHVPPHPGQLRLFDPWGRPTGFVEVAGESYRPQAFHRLMSKHSDFHGPGCEIREPAVLMPDPTNPHGHGTAVAVFITGEHVGYIPAELSNDWRHHLHHHAMNGHALRVPARTWACIRGGGPKRDQVAARVTLTLPEAPEDLYPANGVPGPNPFGIPSGRRVQVTKEEEHQEVLVPRLAGGAGAVLVAVTLTKIEEVRPRSTATLVQVELDGQRVGVLSPTQTARYLPIVEQCAAAGMTCVARATIEGNSLKAEIVLDAQRPDEFDDETLAMLYTARTGAGRAREEREGRDEEGEG